MVPLVPWIKPRRAGTALACLVGVLWLLPPAARAGDYEDLVAAEKAFAADATARGSREAFLAALADDGVVFEPGPVNGKAAWQAKVEDGALLEWTPEVAEVASGGDLGYTAGPWRLTPKGEDAPKARGHYLTVWRKDADGRWKVLSDHGVSHAETPFPATVQRRGGISAAESPPWSVGTDELRKADLAPAGVLSPSMVSSDFLRLRNGRLPDAHAEGAAFPGAGTGRQDSGLVIAKDGDMAVTWGGGPGRPSWLRVWRRPTVGDTPGLGWRLAVDVSRAAAPTDP
jgi:ketosteroid isomerase-like protein